MEAKHINPFITSTVDAFDKMVGCTMQRQNISVREGLNPQYEISGIIGFSGTAVGMVVVSLPKQLALHVASAMLMEEITEINDDVIDAIGELTNMIAGRAKGDLTDFDLRLSLPNVITGRSYEIRFPSTTTPLVIEFQSELGPLTLEVGLANAAVSAEA